MTMMLEWRLAAARAKRDRLDEEIDELLDRLAALPEGSPETAALWEEFRKQENQHDEMDREIIDLAHQLKKRQSENKIKNDRP